MTVPTPWRAFRSAWRHSVDRWNERWASLIEMGALQMLPESPSSRPFEGSPDGCDLTNLGLCSIRAN